MIPALCLLDSENGIGSYFTFISRLNFSCFFENQIWWEKVVLCVLDFAAKYTNFFRMNELTPKGLEKALSQPSVSNVVVQVVFNPSLSI